MKYRKLGVLSCACACAIFVGCQHDLEIRNKSDYQVTVWPSANSQKGLTIGLSASRQHADLLNKIAAEMRRIGEYDVTIIDSQTETADLLTDVDVKFEFDGLSGTGSFGNFFVCWPGFFLATHVWRGYAYTVDWPIRTEIQFSGGEILRENIPISLDVRFSRTGTGMWNHASYAIYPFFTIPAFINGIINLSYDDHVTPEVRLAFDDTAARYVAGTLVKSINQKMEGLK